MYRDSQSHAVRMIAICRSLRGSVVVLSKWMLSAENRSASLGWCANVHRTGLRSEFLKDPLLQRSNISVASSVQVCGVSGGMRAGGSGGTIVIPPVRLWMRQCFRLWRGADVVLRHWTLGANALVHNDGSSTGIEPPREPAK